jgi:hypothetical protein
MEILLILGLGIFIWLLPILVIMSSRKTSGSEKLAWILAVIFISSTFRRISIKQDQ